MRHYHDGAGLVPDPYSAEKSQARIEYHDARDQHRRSSYSFDGADRVMAVVCLAPVALLVTAAVAIFSVAAYLIIATAVLSVCTYVAWPPMYELYHSLMGKHARKQVQRRSVGVAGGRSQLRDISESLLKLPASLREEMRPLWDSSLAACEVLRHAPHDIEAQAILRERSVAVANVLREHQAIAADEAAMLARSKAEESRAVLQSRTVGDVAIADIYVEALREGRARLKELG